MGDFDYLSDSDEDDYLYDEDPLELLAASYLCDEDDPTRLTMQELKNAWGPSQPCTNFMYSYCLKPYNPEDCEEALAISRALKEADEEEVETPLSIWTDGACKENHIGGVGRVAGVGVVFGDPNLALLFGPVEHNMTEMATNNAAELQAAILGLEQARANNHNTVCMNTDSQLLKNIMTEWLEKWKAKNWKKSDGKLPKNIDLVKKLDQLQSEMNITWTWLPRNSSPEMILADALANLGCETAVGQMLRGEAEVNNLFRRTVYDRRMMYSDELPPTVLRTKECVQIAQGDTVNIICTLDISERLKQKVIQNKDDVMNLSSDQAYGMVTTLRTMDPMQHDGTVVAECHAFHATIKQDGKVVHPTLVLPKGSVVGLAFSGVFSKPDKEVNTQYTSFMMWTNPTKDEPREEIDDDLRQELDDLHIRINPRDNISNKALKGLIGQLKKEKENN